MRHLPLIVAALLASTAAHAQGNVAGCRSDTPSGLARCIEENTPPPPEEEVVEEVIEEPALEFGQGVPSTAPGTFRAQTLSPVVLGGALQPTDLRVRPPVAELQYKPEGTRRASRTANERPLSVRNNLRRTGREFRNPYDVDPLAGTVIRVR